MKSKEFRILVMLGLLLVVLLAVGVERFYPGLIHGKKMIRSTEELSQQITKELMKGNDSFQAYVKGINEEELQQINHRLDGFLGHVESFTVIRRLSEDSMQVRFQLNVSNNYYVYQKIVKGKDVSDHVEADILAGKVKNVMDECQADDEYELVKNYHDYIVTHTQYGFLDGDKEILSYTSEGCLMYGKAVCNGYAEAMELLLICSGMDTYMAVGQTDEGGHAWNIVKIHGEWYHVDTTWDDPVPDMGEEALHVYLNVSDEIMEKKHTWNRGAYPACVSMDENYYNKEGSGFAGFNEFKQYVLAQMPEKQHIEVMVQNTDSIKYDCGFVINEGGANSVEWNTYEDGEYMVMYITYGK